jgi:hypothetical protein
MTFNAYDECHFPECHYADLGFSECRYAILLNVVAPISGIIGNDIICKFCKLV